MTSMAPMVKFAKVGPSPYIFTNRFCNLLNFECAGPKKTLKMVKFLVSVPKIMLLFQFWSISSFLLAV